jgi:phosphoribosylglycinamide formyltransferase-1
MSCVVFISGTGSNLNAMCEAGLAPDINLVVSNNPNALGLEVAHKYNISTKVINHRNFNSRQEFETQLQKALEPFNFDYIVLAGFMRILSAEFVNHYAQRIINIHPSILPAFAGGNAQLQAYQARVKVTGLTVHFVTANLDSGPIIAQAVVEVLADDSYDELRNKILTVEHGVYPFIIKKLLQGKVSVTDTGYVKVIHEAADRPILNNHLGRVYY